MDCEVLVIGGGVIGLSIARELRKRGAGKIKVIDRGSLGAESSWAAAGMLAPNIETDETEGFHRFGMESLDTYPAFAKSLLEETGIDIELDRTGTLCLAFNDAEVAALQKTFEQQKKRNVEIAWLDTDDLRELEPTISSDAVAGLRYANDWQVENRKLIEALRKFAELNDISIVENVEVTELIKDGSGVTGVRTAADDIRSEWTVVATGAWTSLIKIAGASFPVRVKPIRGQMISFESTARPLRHVVYSRRGYVVPRADGRVLVGATVEDIGFDKRTTSEAIESLRTAAVEISPRFAELEIAESWAGLRPFAADGLPVIGDVPGCTNALVATAHYRNGILLAPKTAELIAAKIIDDRDSEYFEMFGADRFEVAANANSI